jgi:hypothetical protein
MYLCDLGKIPKIPKSRAWGKLFIHETSLQDLEPQFLKVFIGFSAHLTGGCAGCIRYGTVHWHLRDTGFLSVHRPKHFGVYVSINLVLNGF